MALCSITVCSAAARALLIKRIAIATVRAGALEECSADSVSACAASSAGVYAHIACAAAVSGSLHREMTGGAAEVTGMWNQHGAPCKSRMDYLAGATIFDVKTCRDASPDGFARQIASFSYHLQAAHYSAGYREIVGWDLDRFMFIAVETEAPYMCRLYTLDPRSLQTGRLMMERAALGWKRERVGPAGSRGGEGGHTTKIRSSSA